MRLGLHFIFVCVGITLFAPSLSAAPLSIGIDFVGGSMPGNNLSLGGGPVAVMQPTEIAGVVPQAFWNNAGIGNQSNASVNEDGALQAGGISDSTGTFLPTTSITWDSSATFSTIVSDDPGNNRMMKGYLDTSPTQPANVVISNLPEPYLTSGYDVILYFDGAGTAGPTNRVGRYRVYEGATVSGGLLGEAFGRDPFDVDYAGTFVRSTGNTPETATVGNYVLISGLHAPTISIEAIAMTVTSTNRGPLNGIQIVALPEPTTLSLLAVGTLGLIAAYQRRRVNR